MGYYNGELVRKNKASLLHKAVCLISEVLHDLAFLSTGTLVHLYTLQFFPYIPTVIPSVSD